MIKFKRFTLHILEEPGLAYKAVQARNMTPLGFYDMTVDESRPETLVLVYTTVYAVTRWHEESPTKLVWSIEGDALESIV